MKIRMKFRKQGAMKFIGHLDIMRYFQKVMRRAQVDIRYSEGFSPHQIMSFAAPLGVGLLSNGEYLDIEVRSTESSDTMVTRINEVMSEGMELLSYRRLDDSAKSAMSLVAAADYVLTFRAGKEPEDMEKFFKALEDFYGQKQILITKKTKRGEKEMDLKPLIYELRRAETPDTMKELASPEASAYSVFMKVSTGSTDNIKPELVMEALYASMGWELAPFAFQVEREEVYADLGADGVHRFVSLEDLGEDIEQAYHNET